MTDLVPLADVAARATASLPALVADELGRHRAGWLLGFASANTRRAYSTDLDRWLAFCADHGLDPLSARRAHLDGWAHTLEASGLSARTVARRLASVSSFFAYLVAEEVVGHSPAEHVRRPKVPDRGETPGLNREELRRLLRAAETRGSARTIALLTLPATTGLRINEALSRDVEHVGYDRGHRVLKLERKGGRGDRTVLTAPVVRTLDAYLDGRTSGPLFVTSTGRRMGQPDARCAASLGEPSSTALARFARTRFGSPSLPGPERPECRWRMCRTPRPEGGGRVHTVEQDRHLAGAQHVQIVDAVRAGAHPGDHGEQLGCRVRRTGLDPWCRDRHLPGDDLGQAGLLGQSQYRHQPRVRHQIVLVEPRGAGGEPVGDSH